jgi:hypothetical protein
MEPLRGDLYRHQRSDRGLNAERVRATVLDAARPTVEPS